MNIFLLRCFLIAFFIFIRLEAFWDCLWLLKFRIKEFKITLATSFILLLLVANVEKQQVCITQDLPRNNSRNDLLVVLIFEKIGVLLEVMDIIACCRLGKTNRVFVKRLNGKNSQYILEKKYKLRNIALYNDNESENRNRSRKIAINQGLYSYYRNHFGLVKNLRNEGLIDSFCTLMVPSK